MLTRRSFLHALPFTYGLARLERVLAAFRPQRRVYHVSQSGHDQNAGSSSSPLRTISAGAAKAQPGDIVRVHTGIYRERISPPRGGLFSLPIVYEAAPGEQVIVTGADALKGWVRDKDHVWTAAIPNSFFGNFNPYQELIRGDWFDAKGRDHHTGAVYLNGEWLQEAATLADVYKTQSTAALWFGHVNEHTTTLWAQFEDVDPNMTNVEINVRRTVFYPEKTGIDYITVRGFDLRQAATNWAPPTAEQIGVIGTNWSKGWIIEDNRVSYSVCSGISLGKYGDEYDNLSASSADGYTRTIERAVAHGWSKDKIGHHVVQRNVISHCEQAGIVGSLGPIFCTIAGNEIHDIHVRKLFGGAEMAAIKLHAAIDTVIRDNYIHHNSRGIWLDWMAQGTIVWGNLCHDNSEDDGMCEVDHGPFFFANNVFLSPTTQLLWSQGGAFAHNIIGGVFQVKQSDPMSRSTPFMVPHSTVLAGMHGNISGDMRFYNNIFLQHGDLSQYNVAQLPMFLQGNVFLGGARPCALENGFLSEPGFDPKVQVFSQSGRPVITMNTDANWAIDRMRALVTTELLGHTFVGGMRFEYPDGSAIRVDSDYVGNPRNVNNPFPGPFEAPHGGTVAFAVRGHAKS